MRRGGGRAVFQRNHFTSLCTSSRKFTSLEFNLTTRFSAPLLQHHFNTASIPHAKSSRRNVLEDRATQHAPMQRINCTIALNYTTHHKSHGAPKPKPIDKEHIKDEEVFRNAKEYLEQLVKNIEEQPTKVEAKDMTAVLDYYIRFSLKHRIPNFRTSNLLIRVLLNLPKVRGGNSTDSHSLLVRLAVLGKTEEAFAQFDRFRNERIKLFHLSYGYLMELCGTDAKRAWEIIDWVKQDYQSQKVPVLLWNCLIRIYAKNNDMVAAFSILEKMQKEGTKPHWTTFSAIQDGFIEHQMLNEGITLLSVLKRRFGANFRLATQWYTALLGACSTQTQFDRVVHLMAIDLVTASDHTLKCIIADTAKTGGLPRALKCFHTLRSLPTPPNATLERERQKIAIPKPAVHTLIGAGLMTARQGQTT